MPVCAWHGRAARRELSRLFRKCLPISPFLSGDLYVTIFTGTIILSPQSSTGATGELLHHTTNPCKPYSLLSGKGEIKQQRAYYCCVNYISTQENGRTFCCLSIGKNGGSDSQISQQNLLPVPTACIAQLSHSDQPLLFDQASQGNLSFHPPEILKANNLAKD